MVCNLIDNAQRHAATRVSVELSTSARTVLLAAQDDGPGIPADEQQRVFERFARLDEAAWPTRTQAGPVSVWRSPSRSSSRTVAASP